MVQPAAFGYNAETAATNTFARPGNTCAAPQARRAGQDSGDASGGAAGEGTAQGRPRAQFQALARALASEGVAVCVAEDSPRPVKPDAVFPNNWLSFHEDGTLVLYPLQSASRRPERRQEVIDRAVRELGFRLTHLLDLTHHEGEGRFLEGTGSLVLDHVERVAYACASPRTHPQLVAEWAHELGYDPVIFQAADAKGVPLYHTNVLLCIGARFALVGAEAIAAGDRERVLGRLAASGRDVIAIGQGELGCFAGNMLELATWDEALGDARVLVMSASARGALKPEVFARLSGCTDTVLAVPVPAIEALGGGSVRCMLTEVFRS